MSLKDIALSNKDLIQDIKSKMPGELDKYWATLDTATARLNTIMLKVSQHPVMEQENIYDITQCDHAIKSFYKWTKRLDSWPFFTRPFIKTVLHGIGTKRIPRIKNLQSKLDNY